MMTLVLLMIALLFLGAIVEIVMKVCAIIAIVRVTRVLNPGRVPGQQVYHLTFPMKFHGRKRV